ncbi:uncharacterized protein SOCE26_002240 [Sorangium cellulosum]|uniref:Uncharacterized protein n=2 Tax=Sorangium cellulosum TaxID=56 RepID=A0A2L0EHS1_SORCE|nr:uncharacterized protein SOCE26_002240 [Sorangium cellulosum]
MVERQTRERDGAEHIQDVVQLMPVLLRTSKRFHMQWVLLGEPSRNNQLGELPASSSPASAADFTGDAALVCEPFYDRALSNRERGVLRGAYASEDHAERGPSGAAADLTRTPEFASCAIERVVESFLGRPLRADEEALLGSLRALFVARGHRMRPLVGALVRAPAYARANDLRPALERGGDVR